MLFASTDKTLVDLTCVKAARLSDADGTSPARLVALLTDDGQHAVNSGGYRCIAEGEDAAALFEVMCEVAAAHNRASAWD